MYRSIIAFLGALLLASGAMAQTGTLTAKVIDSLTRETISGATIEIISVQDAAKKQRATSNAQGNISVSGLAYDNYRVHVSLLGYETLERSVRINKAQTALGTLRMRQVASQIEEVVLAGYAIRTSQKGDTVVYNADAFKVSKDADAEALLSKMPGITITDGVVEAQGEEVKKVFVDGKEFFGDNVSATIKNLPAEVIQKVEAYNRLSDAAQFTGVDDGEGYKAINIVTKPSMRTGAFGKLYAGYGYSDKYVAGGNVNFFTGKHRLSLIGLANNVNQQNFSMEDILGATNSGGGSRGGGSRGGPGSSGGRGRGGSYYSSGVGNFMVSPQGGVSTVGSVGLNYSGQWKEKVDVTGSYFFNETQNHRMSITEREWNPIKDTIRWENIDDRSDSRNFNHRFNGKLDWKVNENNSLSVRPSLSLQRYSSDSEGNTLNRAQFITDWQKILLSDMKSIAESKSSGYNASLEVIWMHKFKKPGRTITLETTGSYNLNDRNGYNNDTTKYHSIPDPDVIFNRNTIDHSYGYRLGETIVYTEPLTEKSQLVFNYRGRYSYSDSDRKRYNFVDELHTEFDPDCSNVYNSGYFTHRVGPGLRYGGEKTLFVANFYYQRSVLTKEQDFPILYDAQKNPLPASTSAIFNNFTYFGMMTQTFNPQNTLRVYLSSSTDNPSLTQLQNYIDVSNSLNLVEGNPSLIPTMGHRVSATYNRSSATKGRTFMASLSYSLTQNDIVDYTLFADKSGELKDKEVMQELLEKIEKIQPYSRYTSYRNISGGSWSTRGTVTFGTPVKLIRSNVNFSVGGQVSQSPSYIDAMKNTSAAQRLYAGTTIGSNINENLDFTLSYNYDYNRVHNSLKSENDRTRSNNLYWSQNVGARLKWIFWKGFTFTGNSTYMQYTGITSNFREEFMIVNLYLGKKIFKNQRGEINFGVNDLLNRNKSFMVSTLSQYIQSVTNNVISRYYSIQFTYNLRTFKGRAPQESNRDEFREGGVRMYGPGGPGGPPPEGGGYRGPGGPGGSGPMIRP